MSRCSDLLAHRSHNRRPDFESVSYKLDGSEIFLNINRREFIEDIGYRSINDLEDSDILLFESISALAIGLPLDIANEIELDSIHEYLADEEWVDKTKTQFFNKPLFMFQKAIGLFKGEIELERSEDYLVCRCFGVHENKIIDIIKSNPTVDLKDLTGMALCGGGCTNCCEDLQFLIKEYGEVIEEKQNLTEPQKNRVIKIIADYLENPKIQVEFKETEVLLKGTPERFGNNEALKLESIIDSETGVKINIIL